MTDNVIEFHEAKRKVSRFGSGHRIHCALLESYWHAGLGALRGPNLSRVRKVMDKAILAGGPDREYGRSCDNALRKRVCLAYQRLVDAIVEGGAGKRNIDRAVKEFLHACTADGRS